MRIRWNRSRWLFAAGAAAFLLGGATGAFAWRACRGTGNQTVQASRPAARPAAEIVREFRGVHTPGLGNRLSEEEFDRQLADALEHQNRLALELYDASPRDHAAAQLLFVRWSNLVNGLHRPDPVLQGTEKILSAPATRAVIAVAKRARADAAIGCAAVDDARAEAWLESAVAAEPVDTAVSGNLLEQFAEERTADPARQRVFVSRAAALYPPETFASRPAEEWGLLRVLGRLGTPLDLEFDDALTNTHWRADPGRPVLVHMWSAGRWDLKLDQRDPDVDDLSRALPALTAAGVRVVAVEGLGRNGGRIDAATAARDRGIAWPYAIETARSNVDQFTHGGYSAFLWVDAQGHSAAWCRKLGPLMKFAGL